MLKYHKFSILLVVTAIVFYGAFGYDLVRSDFFRLLSLYVALFFVSYKLIQIHKTNFWFLAGVALVFRLVFLFAIPNLSQDFYRFIWDGRLMMQGLNPYLSTPKEFISSGNYSIVSQAQQLYDGMGNLNASHFTNYPPVCQWIYAVAGLLAHKSILGSVIVMRLFLIAADFGTLYFGKKLLEKLNFSAHRIFLYILNPAIILELTGNLHFEGLMVFFLIAFLYFLFHKKWLLSAVFIGLSISVKLVPLILLPTLFNYFRKQEHLNLQKLLVFYGLTALTISVTFLPFLSGRFMENFIGSVGLWFHKFEFNASVYYVIRWLGFKFVGYNIIYFSGIVLSIITFLGVMRLSFYRKNNSLKKLITSMLWAFSLYLLLATTVHPWYLVTLLGLSIFTRYKFPLVWSLMIVLSYFAYGTDGFHENLAVVALEYIVVIGVFLYEVKAPEREFYS